MAEATRQGNDHFSHFGPEANLFEDLETLFRSYAESGSGQRRKYLHNDEEASPSSRSPAPSRRGRRYLPRHRPAVLRGAARRRRHRQGRRRRSTPTCWSAWSRSSTWSGSRRSTATRRTRGYSTEAVVDTILRRMPDYVHYICPQFARTHINFQRVPMVDTSNPFIARYIPTADESMRRDPLREPEGHRLSRTC